jgi:S-adenosylmethionine:diacylglycerol 3-amino-3-carboxypropyl transferase
MGPPELVFGRMLEDRALELALFPRGGRVFCIASAGCTALALAARGDRVTAVDVNPAQVEYVRARLAGGPVREGAADRRTGRLRTLAPLVGWRRPALERFCDLDDPPEQARVWTRLETHRLRLAARILLSRRVLMLGLAAPFVRVVPSRFDRILLRRLARGFATHPNRSNPYARLILLGETTAVDGPAQLELVSADAAEYLESCPPQTFDAITLSNVLDGPEPGYAARLLEAVQRAAARGAVAVLRSFAEPVDAEEDAWAARDRAFIWGRIRVWSP